MIREDVEKWAEENTDLSFDRIERGYNWNGYEVWEEIYEKPAIVGYPTVILVKGNEIRESDPQESLDYLDYSEKQPRRTNKNYDNL